MVYVALLRGINVGGNRKVPMAQLKLTFERMGFSQVRTFIASGNVIFCSDSNDQADLTAQIEKTVHKNFGFKVSTLLRSTDEIEKLVKAIPSKWVNDKEMKCDVMFLWPKVDGPNILVQLPSNPEIEDIKYFPGAVVWRIDRDKASKSRMFKIVGTKLFKQMTVRNPNTVRKLLDLTQEAAKS